MTIRKPNFFVVGAARCGTSAMHTYLRRHPDVFLPSQKELLYFSRDLGFVRPRPSLDEYLACFAKATSEKMLGDASPLALYSKTAPGEIKAFCPDAKIVIMLRNPVDEMYSHHGQLLFTGDEPITDFEEALAAEPRRKLGEMPYRGTICPEVLFYREVARFAPQVQRYMDAFGRENVHVNLFEDLKGDTGAVYRATLQFLGVDPNFRPDLGPVNANKVYRSNLLRRLRHAPALRKVARSVVPAAVRTRVEALLLPLVAVHTKRTPMGSALRSRLQDDCREEVQQLGEILQRDLSHWCD